jgi:dinuclear metal center YbgI/SA1388 family protein
MLLQNITDHLETIAPLPFQESYDNAGLIVGDKSRDISSALIALDVTEEVIDEAISFGCELIISHHPLIFKGIKRITGSNVVERCLIKAIKKDIAIYAAHTNLDSITGGVNSKICEKIGLEKCRILAPAKNQLLKLVTYVPEKHLEIVRSALFAAGAGVIGNYDQCSFINSGYGTFRGNEDSKPFVGTVGILHSEPEIRFETIIPRHLSSKIVAALNAAHPYEEVAFDLVPIENNFPSAGSGMIGQLSSPVDVMEFLSLIKGLFGCEVIKHTELLNKKICKVAVCGGSGSFLINNAIAEGADLYITADLKYHDYFEADKRIVLADIGHYESEQFTKEVLKEIVLKKFPTFALHLSDVKTNPVSYF